MSRKITLFEPVRKLFLREHEFFVKQAQSRIFDNFKDQDIEREAEKEKEDFFEHEGSKPYSEDVDMGDVAEYAEEHGNEFGEMLYEMKFQIILAVLASLYHQWDKNLRERLEHELRFGFSEDELKKVFWKRDIAKMLNTLEQSTGWDIRKESWYPKIDACRLIVNVYKHGKGISLDELKEKYPQYLEGPHHVLSSEFDKLPPRYENLWVAPEDFEEIADAFRQFWAEFP